MCECHLPCPCTGHVHHLLPVRTDYRNGPLIIQRKVCLHVFYLRFFFYLLQSAEHRLQYLKPPPLCLCLCLSRTEAADA